MRFGEFEGEAGTVEVVDSPQRLTFTWGSDRVTFEFASTAAGTRFALIHTFDDRFGAPSFATGWEGCLAGLRSVLAGEPPAPPDRGIARHEDLVHEFGLDRPEVTESDGRWTARVERQLTCPAEVAWDLWFGKDRHTGEQRTAPAVGEALTPYMAPELVIGTVTEVDLHRVLAFDVAPTGGPGEHVRIEFAPGTGHGVRITLTVTGTEGGESDAAAQKHPPRAGLHLRCGNLTLEWKEAPSLDGEGASRHFTVQFAGRRPDRTF